jgi:hypothetical protein
LYQKVGAKVRFVLPNKAYLEAEAAKDGVIFLDSLFGWLYPICSPSIHSFLFLPRTTDGDSVS